MPNPKAQQFPEQPGSVLVTAVRKSAELLGLNQRALANVLGVSEPTVSRLMRNERPVDISSHEGQCAILLVRAFRSLDALVGGSAEKARQWFHAPNTGVGGEIPAERVQTVEGLVDVVHYLDAMRGNL